MRCFTGEVCSCHSQPDPLTPGERLCRALRKNGTARVFGPCPGARRGPSPENPQGVRQSLHPGASASGAIPSNPGAQAHPELRRRGDSAGRAARRVGSRIPAISSVNRNRCTPHDYVIVDTPPLLLVSDGLAISSLVDGVILTSRMRESTVDQAREMRQVLALSLIHI